MATCSLCSTETFAERRRYNNNDRFAPLITARRTKLSNADEHQAANATVVLVLDVCRRTLRWRPARSLSLALWRSLAGRLGPLGVAAPLSTLGPRPSHSISRTRGKDYRGSRRPPPDGPRGRFH